MSLNNRYHPELDRILEASDERELSDVEDTELDETIEDIISSQPQQGRRPLDHTPNLPLGPLTHYFASNDRLDIDSYRDTAISGLDSDSYRNTAINGLDSDSYRNAAINGLDSARNPTRHPLLHYSAHDDPVGLQGSREGDGLDSRSNRPLHNTFRQESEQRTPPALTESFPGVYGLDDFQADAPALHHSHRAVYDRLNLRLSRHIELHHRALMEDRRSVPIPPPSYNSLFLQPPPPSYESLYPSPPAYEALYPSRLYSHTLRRLPLDTEAILRDFWSDT